MARRAPQAGSTAAEGKLPAISGLLLRLFRPIVRRYFRRHFRSVMVQGKQMLQGRRGPLIIYGNHSSWWDPMISMLLAAELLPGARHYAPIDANALLRYPILGRLGLFPVELASPRGAVEFLRTAEAILSAGGVLWITPQGRFADPRAALRFRPGLGALAARLPAMPLLPIAVEYTFWDERLPEALVRCGTPVRLAEGTTAAAATQALEAALAAEMSALQQASCARDPNAFDTLLTGARGSGGFYSIGRRLRAWSKGRRFEPDHTPR